MNVPLALIVAGAGGLLIWAGIADPDGGVSGILGAMLRGEPLPKLKNPPATPESLTSLGGALGGAVGELAAGLGAGVTGTGKAAIVIAEARKQLGKPYVYGDEGPNTFDCSGLTLWCYAKAGVKLPRVASAQKHAGKDTKTPQPGDLVFWGQPATHCGIVIDDGKTMIHAPHTGDVVKVAPINDKGRPSPRAYRTYPNLTR